MKPNIIELVVKENRCIGCGACVSICPVNVLSMDFNSSGLYEPKEISGCLKKCSLCLKVCPFYEKDQYEDILSKELFYGLEYKQHIGYFINTYEFSKLNLKEKLCSASGGSGNYLLKKLLELDLVDELLTVKPNDDPNKLFKFNVFKSEDEIDESRGSVYYPVSMDEVLEYVLKNDKRYAITALPCFAKAIRLFQKNNHKAKNRIKFIVGLVCGQMKSKDFAQQIADETFKNKTLIKSVNFRKKIPHKTAYGFAFEFEDINGDLAIDYRDKSAFKYWTSRAFTPLACNNCIDVFAKCADVTLMDAWLDEKIKDYSGHSLLIVRNKIFDEILKNVDKNDVFCKKIDPDLVIKSQNGAIDEKNSFYFYDKQNILNKKIVRIKKNIQKQSLKDKKMDEIKLKKLKKQLKLKARKDTIIYLFKKHILRKTV